MCVTLYLRVGEPGQKSTRVSQVKNQLVLKFVKKFQPNMNPWRVRLAREFQSILTILSLHMIIDDYR